jgi:hypothetical protein
VELTKSLIVLRGRGQVTSCIFLEQPASRHVLHRYQLRHAELREQLNAIFTKLPGGDNGRSACSASQIPIPPIAAYGSRGRSVRSAGRLGRSGWLAARTARTARNVQASRRAGPGWSTGARISSCGPDWHLTDSDGTGAPAWYRRHPWFMLSAIKVAIVANGG